MTHYIDADRLREKIEKYLAADNSIDTDFYIGRSNAEGCILTLIDSLQQERPEAPVDGEVHHVLNCHYLTTDNTQLCARLREFPEGAKVDIFIIEKEEK